MGRYSKLKEEMKETIAQLRDEMNNNHSETKLDLKDHLGKINKAIPKAVNDAVHTDRETRRKELSGRRY